MENKICFCCQIPNLNMFAFFYKWMLWRPDHLKSVKSEWELDLNWILNVFKHASSLSLKWVPRITLKGVADIHHQKQPLPQRPQLPVSCSFRPLKRTDWAELPSVARVVGLRPSLKRGWTWTKKSHCLAAQLLRGLLTFPSTRSDYYNRLVVQPPGGGGGGSGDCQNWQHDDLSLFQALNFDCRCYCCHCFQICYCSWSLESRPRLYHCQLCQVCKTFRAPVDHSQPSELRQSNFCLVNRLCSCWPSDDLNSAVDVVASRCHQCRKALRSQDIACWMVTSGSKVCCWRLRNSFHPQCLKLQLRRTILK